MCTPVLRVMTKMTRGRVVASAHEVVSSSAGGLREGPFNPVVGSYKYQKIVPVGSTTVALL
jgi:hypothetical protein